MLREAFSLYGELAKLYAANQTASKGIEMNAGGASHNFQTVVDVVSWPNFYIFASREIQNFGNLEFQKFGIQPTKQLKVQIRSAQHVGKVWIIRKNPPGPIWGHPRPFSPWIEKMQKKKYIKIGQFSLVGQWALFTRFGVMCWRHLTPKRSLLIVSNL